MASDKLVASALERLEKIKRKEAFDPNDITSKPTKAQSEFFADIGKYKQYWIKSGNQSGKSASCARIVCQFIEETHPVVATRRAGTWGQEPLLIIIAGRTGKQIEDSLLPKLRAQLEPNTYKEVRIGNIIQRLEFENGNRIIFQSLENPNVARERLMSYVAHMTWVDELPPTLDLVREILVRTQARDGYNIFSFTPTVVSVEIQKFVDSISAPEGKIYKFLMLDNPLYADPERREALLRRYAHMPEAIKKAIFSGEWLSADDQVYHFDYKSMVEMPEGYSPMWRHIESVDPAISSATGLVVLAEHPDTGIWHIVLAEYIKGIQVPTEIVTAVKHFTERVNVVRRTSDYAPWFVNTASSMGIHYMTIREKNANRKEELIKGLQQALGSKVKISPNCQHLLDEIVECRWSSSSEGKMMNSSSYHLLDAAQYAVDCLPPADKRMKSFTVDQWYGNLLAGNQKRLQMEDKVMSRITTGKIKGRHRWK